MVGASQVSEAIDGNLEIVIVLPSGTPRPGDAQ